MTSIRSRRHPFKFYLTLAFTFVSTLGLSIFLLYLFSEELNKPHSVAGLCLFLAMDAILFFLTFYIPYTYFKNAPTLTVDAAGILFHKERYDWSDIEELELTGKQPFRLLTTFAMEGMMFRFRNGIVKYAIDDMYANAAEIKSFIQALVVEKKNPENKRKQTQEIKTLPLQDLELFRGNQFTSFHGIMLWAGTIGILIFMALSLAKNNTTGACALACLLSVFFFFFSYSMNYMALSNDQLLVKNHNLPWKNHVYQLDMIKEVVFESQGNQPNCLRVITTDFRNKLYHAATLRDKTWLTFEKSLTERGIIVRNECIMPLS